MYPHGSNSMHTHKMWSPASVKSSSTSQTFLFRHYTPSQQLHSSADTQCSGYHLSSGQCSFSYQAPTTWNRLLVMLPLSVLSDLSLKTLHFSQTFSSVPQVCVEGGACICELNLCHQNIQVPCAKEHVSLCKRICNYCKLFGLLL